MMWNDACIFVLFVFVPPFICAAIALKTFDYNILAINRICHFFTILALSDSVILDAAIDLSKDNTAPPIMNPRKSLQLVANALIGPTLLNPMFNNPA
jgi:hypothetical protein